MPPRSAGRVRCWCEEVECPAEGPCSGRWGRGAPRTRSREASTSPSASTCLHGGAGPGTRARGGVPWGRGQGRGGAVGRGTQGPASPGRDVSGAGRSKAYVTGAGHQGRGIPFRGGVIRFASPGAGPARAGGERAAFESGGGDGGTNAGCGNGESASSAPLR